MAASSQISSRWSKTGRQGDMQFVAQWNERHVRDVLSGVGPKVLSGVGPRVMSNVSKAEELSSMFQVDVID